MTFRVGYHSLHPDASMNFQMNRWFDWVGEPGMLEEMRMAAPRIATHADWKREFLALAERASQQGLVLRAGFYWRAAEFFMQTDDPERKSAREKFLGAVRSVYGLEQRERHAVPYADGRLRGLLPAYRFEPPRAKCTIVFFGGFDSYIEELTSAFVYLRDAGYDVIAGVFTLWGYGLFIDNKGDYVDKPMAQATGQEILTELMHHLGCEDILDEVRRASTVIPVMMPYITSEFARRAVADRPLVIPQDAKNFALLGQYVEIPEDVVFTVEYSVRGGDARRLRLARPANEIPAIYHGIADPKVALDALRTLMG